MSKYVYRLLKNQLYAKGITLNAIIAKKYVKKFCRYYANSIFRKKNDTCIICYENCDNFINLPCCCEQLICLECSKVLLEKDIFKCMFCREPIQYRKEILDKTFEFIKTKPFLRKRLREKRMKYINSSRYKRKWEVEMMIIMSEILNNIKNSEFRLCDIKSFKFINTFTLEVRFKDNRIINFTLDKSEFEL